jgi:replicative DNA helicase
MAEILDVDEIAARVAGVASGEAAPVSHLVKPMSEACVSLVEMLVNEEGRWLFGVPELDSMVRGVGRGELMYITGRAHSGKTQLVLQSIINNPSKRVLFYTPDEAAELVLAKLMSIETRTPADEIEWLVRNKDKSTLDRMRELAEGQLSNMMVVDQSIGFIDMTHALQEAEQYWGQTVDVVVIDFLELLPGDDVSAKSRELKRWAKHENVPCLCLHQASRSSGARGQAAGMDAMRYGGETEAMYVAEVFRRRDDMSMDEQERSRWMNTVSVNLAKNKRPPSRVGIIDLFLDPNFGGIRTLRDEDMYRVRREVDHDADPAEFARQLQIAAGWDIEEEWEDD